MLFEAFAAVLSGALSGFVLGLIGGGGSVLATPLLLYFVGVASPHVALGTGALAVSLNAFANLAGHARKGHVLWRCAFVFSAFGMVGAFLGSTLGKLIDGDALLFLFGLAMVAVGASMLRPRKLMPGERPPITRGSCYRAAAMAVLTGAASGFFGIGGGFLIVPALILATGMATINAVGTSLMAVGVFGLTTAANYAVSGLIDWGVAAEFLAGGLGGGLVGLSLASRLSANKDALNRVFAAVVFIVAAYVIYRAGGALFAPG
ncbi:TSUP family transporter [Pleomorphomonas sp. JP5]|uniref:sulfite exporter TauE/SafE family protein n=1 Tax=Pleomorphomonas sp. JP5 TaxID=2942998 RepID=UPI0020443FF2|nr:TSUP family transporter [Pleomorphomonas sp. JP5]MCM5558938.1 sulfite exporter TauE/SafE family protein [Pleomorphomonas sp. JP5]